MPRKILSSGNKQMSAKRLEEQHEESFWVSLWPFIHPGQDTIEATNPKPLTDTDKINAKESLFLPAKRLGKGWPSEPYTFFCQYLLYSGQTPTWGEPSTTTAWWF